MKNQALAHGKIDNNLNDSVTIGGDNKWIWILILILVVSKII
jgi:hypothetical protein